MDVFEAVRTLLAVRSYGDTPIPDAVVRRIVEAGRLTGSGMNSQPWHFIVVRDRNALRRLGELVSSGPYVGEAPLAIVVAIDKTRSRSDSSAMKSSRPAPSPRARRKSAAAPQLENRQGAWPHDPTVAAAARGSGDRVVPLAHGRVCVLCGRALRRRPAA